MNLKPHEKLKSHFENLRDSLLPQASKAALAALMLWLSNEHALWWVAWVIMSAGWYVQAPFLNRRLAVSFVVLMVVSFLLQANGIGGFHHELLAPLVFGPLFFVVLCIKNLAIVRRQLGYVLVQGMLILVVLMLFFAADRSQALMEHYFLTGFALLMLLREFHAMTGLQKEESGAQKPLLSIKGTLSALILVFLAFQLLWVVSLLPIGFLRNSMLVLLPILALEDMIMRRMKGKLTATVVARNSAIFMLLLGVILGSAQWEI